MNKILKKNLLFCIGIFLVLILSPLISAGNYGAGIYGAGVYGVGEVPVIPPTPPSGGGSSQSCSYNWQCINWFPSICPESGIQERICVNKGTCKGVEGMPNQNQTCEYLGPTEPLFDIYLTLSEKDKETCSGKEIKANVKLENYAKVELLDAFMTYWIIDENNNLIAEYKDTRAVEKETSFNIEMKIPESTPEGTYRLYAEITYSGNKTAVSGESFEIVSKEDCSILSSKGINLWLMYGFAVVIAIIIIFFLIKLIRMKKKQKRTNTHEEYKMKIKRNLKRINSKNLLIILIGLIMVWILFTKGRTNIAGFVINVSNSFNNPNWSIIGFIFLIGIFGFLIFTYREKIAEKINLAGINKIPKDHIRGLIKKKVYSEEGDYIGKVEDAFLEENKLDSLKIKLSKHQKFKVKGIILKYKDVLVVGNIVIVDGKILEKLNI